jgi:hypothetical protein
MSPRGQRHGVHGRARRAYYYNERDKQRAYLRGINNGTIKGPMTLLHEAGKPHDPFKCGECYIERAKVMTDASFIASLHRDGRPHDSDACDGCKNVPDRDWPKGSAAWEHKAGRPHNHSACSICITLVRHQAGLPHLRPCLLCNACLAPHVLQKYMPGAPMSGETRKRLLIVLIVLLLIVMLVVIF